MASICFKSDVWSMGVLLIEMFTNGSTPYPDLSTSAVMRKVKAGYQMLQPRACSNEVFSLAQTCWKIPEERPSFAQLAERLETILDARRPRTLFQDGSLSSGTPPLRRGIATFLTILTLLKGVTIVLRKVKN